MSHYRSNLRDLEFTLFEVLGRGDLLGSGPYSDIDADTAREMLAELDRTAREDLAPSLLDSDRHPPVFDPAAGTVTLPESFKRSYRTYQDAQWWRMDVPAELGGTAVPPSVRWAMAELVLGANPAIHMYASAASFASVLHELGTPGQKELARHMVEGEWGATMVLTEPDAGSDVGAGRASAVQQPDGTWHVTGVKRFITSAAHDLSDSIVHFVLARPVGAGPGTKGLSLFIVPGHHVDLATGALGAVNGVQVTGVEHKMGLKVSTTCEVRFGESEPAVATLLGDVHDGIAQMFRIIEFARMMVGTKAIATLSTGYLNALAFAKERVQGADLARQGDRDAPRVAITAHPDVRRSLMLQKSYAEGLRALVLFTASQQDAVDLAQRTGSSAADAERLNDFLLPIVKGAGSERSWVLLGTESLQTFGGSGFLEDYPVEQYVRDAKIDTLYEGTTAIQGLDLFFRKIVRDEGRALSALSAMVLRTVKGEDGTQGLATERESLGRALDDVHAMVASMVGHVHRADPRSPDAHPRALYLVGQNTTRLLLAVGDLLVGWLLLRGAEVAQTALEAASDQDSTDAAFYRGKVAAARFFARTVLPTLAAERGIVETTDNSLMDLDVDAF